MRTPTHAAALMLVAWASTSAHAQPPATRTGDPAPPAPVRAAILTTSRSSAAAIRKATRSASRSRPVTCRTTARKKSDPTRCPIRWFLPSGERVTSADQWFKERRPEILKFYREQIYGHVPASAPAVTWTVAETNAGARGGTAVMRRVTGRMGSKPDGPRMNLTVYLPAKASGPVPLLLSITFGFPAARPGTAGKAGQPPATTPGKATPAKPAAGLGPGARGFDPVAEVLDRGWGYASLPYGEIQPDRADRWTEGVIGLTLKEGQTRPAADEWGTISAWAWGISRAIDYLQTDPVGRRQADRHHRRFAAGQDRPLGRPRRTSAWRRCSRSSPARWERP